MNRKLFCLLILLSAYLGLSAAARAAIEATPEKRLLKESWPASWICDPEGPTYDYGVYHFRKRFTLEERPERFVVNVSADNRYRLFVNGTPVCWGPARGDLNRWYYETIDIAPYLQRGDNVLAAQVWNMGKWHPSAQISLRTGFILQGNTPAEEAVNTDGSWRVCRNEGFSPLFNFPETLYMGGTDRIDGAVYPWGWETVGFDDGAWRQAAPIFPGKTYGAFGGETNWVLTPRDIPLMEETLERIPRIRRCEGLDAVPDFVTGNDPLTVPANTRCSILLDQTFLTTAYPEIVLSGGRGSLVRATYSEALFDEKGKGNRDEIEGREIRGHADEFLPGGGDKKRLFRPLWFKTYRYIQLDIETGEEPLTIHDCYGMYTGYPFEVRGSFSSDDPALQEIWDVGWRTARLCAHETYFDCPYYEQLQYAGDTRIQALISLYVSGDDRLMRKAIRMFDLSRSYEGITMSRYPSQPPQYIPPFSLYWVGMVHDYWMHRADDAFVGGFLPGIRTVVDWFVRQVDPATGLLKSDLPHWCFVDWAEGWVWGIPPRSERSGSAILTLQFAVALRDAAQLIEHFGDRTTAGQYEKLYETLVSGVYKGCWDPDKGLLRDCIGASSYSQHANIMGILTDAVPVERQQEVFRRITTDPSVLKTSFYYRFYLIRAMKKAGLSGAYLDMLGPWKDMIGMGLTTFAETPEPTRSDCHAWSASPNYDLLATVCGVEPDSPGFASVKIEPHMGRLTRMRGVVPHPEGDITVDLRREGKRIYGRITIPGVKARLVCSGKDRVLNPGVNEVEFSERSE